MIGVVYQLFKENKGSCMYDLNLHAIGSFNLKDDEKISGLALEHVWDLCNASCWSDWTYGLRVEKNGNTLNPTPYYKGYVNDDIIVMIDGMFYYYDTITWKHDETIGYPIHFLVAKEFDFASIKNKDMYNQELVESIRKAR